MTTIECNGVTRTFSAPEEMALFLLNAQESQRWNGQTGLWMSTVYRVVASDHGRFGAGSRSTGYFAVETAAATCFHDAWHFLTGEPC